MGLHELTLRNFRLFEEIVIRPDPEEVTVFLSPNGTGKTSVLEAVHALATGSSFRTTSGSDLVRNGWDVAEAHGVIFDAERRIQVDLTVTRNRRGATKRMLVNGQRPRSRAELARALPLTVFTPEGVEVIRGGPDARRDFLSMVMEDADATNADLHERFARTLTQRNALLKGFEGRYPTHERRIELDTWTDELIEISHVVVARRREMILELGPLVEDRYRSIAQSSSVITLTYETSWADDLTTALADSLNEDVRRGYTTVGPHRDDAVIRIDTRDSRRQASQGEQRSLALALRLAGHEVVRRARHVEPVLLLDDVFSELDPGRCQRLLELLPRGQTLVTTASPLPGALSPTTVIDLSER